MTVKASFRQKKSFIDGLLSFFCLTLAVVMVLLGDRLKRGVLEGLNFSLMTLIPTLFPFFILSDFWSACFTVKESGFFGRIFERLFGIKGCALSAFLSGLICGFPIGVKSASELCRTNKISLDEFERLAGFVNNPSIAFIISGVGVGIFGDISLGVFLYISVVLSSVAVGIFFKKQITKSNNSNVISRQSFNLVSSIKNAGTTSISVISYIIFFSGIIEIFKSLIENEYILSLISSLLEVSSATRLIGNGANFAPYIRYALTAFALGFSGLSVHLQALSFFPDGASRRKYFLMKLIQGMLSALFMSILVAIFQ